MTLVFFFVGAAWCALFFFRQIDVSWYLPLACTIVLALGKNGVFVSAVLEVRGSAGARAFSSHGGRHCGRVLPGVESSRPRVDTGGCRRGDLSAPYYPQVSDGKANMGKR